MRSYKIGVIGDTHVPEGGPTLPYQVEEEFRGADLILHVGDVTSSDLLRELSSIAPVVAVRGESDALDLPARIVILVDRVRIGLLHGSQPARGGLLPARRAEASARGTRWNRFLQRLASSLPPVECIVFGHLHRPYMGWHDGILFFSPGSVFHRTPEITRAELAENPPLQRRLYLQRWLADAEREPDRVLLPPSLGLLTISQGRIQAEVRSLTSSSLSDQRIAAISGHDSAE